MTWLRKPKPTQTIRVGDRGILTVPEDMTLDELRPTINQIRQALRTSRLIVLANGMTYTPLPPRRRIRLARTERWLAA